MDNAKLPSRALKFPFTARNGSATTVTDPKQVLESYLVFCLSTSVGERVMEPDWGIDIENSYFALGSELEGFVAEAVREALHKWFPGVTVRAISTRKIPMQPSFAEVTVKYATADGAYDGLLQTRVQLPSGTEVGTDEVMA